VSSSTPRGTEDVHAVGVDIQGHPDQAHVGVALKELRDACAFFKVLGTYPIDVH
jgi:prephenate dehydratase